MKIVKWSAEPTEPKLVLQCRGAGAFSVSGTRSPPYPQTRDFSSEGASSGPWGNRQRPWTENSRIQGIPLAAQAPSLSPAGVPSAPSPKTLGTRPPGRVPTSPPGWRLCGGRAAAPTHTVPGSAPHSRRPGDWLHRAVLVQLPSPGAQPCSV